MEPYYGLIELTFFGVVVLGLAIYELIRVRRALREDRAKHDASADGGHDGPGG